MTQDAIIAAARACVGTPFRHQGRLLGVALDCAGVAVHVANTLGLSPIDPAGYGRTPAFGMLEATLDGEPFLEPVTDLSDRQPGDLLLMRFTAEPQHLAIFTGDTINHAYEAPGLCCEHLFTDRWQKRIVCVYRFVGVTP
ncbi:MAG: C40 family peptidase [Candidatus Accumulibacter sp.]|jgi:cell wall-associated NlpC family hydrolase|uniref:C40 family peptidase n=1 Tax=Candidatus Accumulibacter affinis TaxID=2954384 RepID=A0A935TA31_9PROT|nr:C40 family peptidase [Candidatus Accumulibacter affinis]